MNSIAPIYLDWNASAPLCDNAMVAMINALDYTGNPSSVHSHGRKAKSLVENARKQIADAFGAGQADIVFTSGATEAAALALADRNLLSSAIEHDAVRAWTLPRLKTNTFGHVSTTAPSNSCIQLANGETGVVQNLPDNLAVSDLTQACGKIPVAFDEMGCDMALISAHKLGGPCGIGALILKKGIDIPSRIRGGGQEMGRRSGTENLVGIVGFGAAAESSSADLENGYQDELSNLRDLLEDAVLSELPDTEIVGADSNRLPNTSCILMRGWKGETQVMAMDLAGYSISAGSACSSGKVTPSPVLQALGYDLNASKCAIRVSLGLKTTENDILRFAEALKLAHTRYRSKAA